MLKNIFVSPISIPLWTKCAVIGFLYLFVTLFIDSLVQGGGLAMVLLNYPSVTITKFLHTIHPQIFPDIRNPFFVGAWLFWVPLNTLIGALFGLALSLLAASFRKCKTLFSTKVFYAETIQKNILTPEVSGTKHVLRNSNILSPLLSHPIFWPSVIMMGAGVWLLYHWQKYDNGFLWIQFGLLVGFSVFLYRKKTLSKITQEPTASQLYSANQNTSLSNVSNSDKKKMWKRNSIFGGILILSPIALDIVISIPIVVIRVITHPSFVLNTLWSTKLQLFSPYYNITHFLFSLVRRECHSLFVICFDPIGFVYNIIIELLAFICLSALIGYLQTYKGISRRKILMGFFGLLLLMGLTNSVMQLIR